MYGSQPYEQARKVIEIVDNCLNFATPGIELVQILASPTEGLYEIDHLRIFPNFVYVISNFCCT